jgi:hypothetical protein
MLYFIILYRIFFTILFDASPYWMGTPHIWYGRRVSAKGFSKGTPDFESRPKHLFNSAFNLSPRYKARCNLFQAILMREKNFPIKEGAGSQIKKSSYPIDSQW